MLNLFKRATKSAPQATAAPRANGGTADERVRDGLQHHQAGRLREAEATYADALRLDPQNIDALHFSGVIAYQEGRYEEAHRLISQALSLNRANPPAHNNLGNVWMKQGRPEEATASFEQAIALQPDYLDAHLNLAGAWSARDRPEQALACYRSALRLLPNSYRLRLELAQALASLGRPAEAIDSCLEAVRLEPNSPEAHAGLGHLFREVGRLDEAAASCQRALALKPDFAPALSNLGNVLKDKGQLEQAAACYRRAIELDPNAAGVRYNLGDALSHADRTEEAVACFREALAIDPEFAEARWALAMAQLPAICESDAEPERRRQAFARELGELERWFDGARLARGAKAVGARQPFYLAYQEHNNRPLLERYGNLCARIMSEWSRGQGLAAPSGERRNGGPIRVGVVSQHFRNHSVWNAIVRGWFQKLDPTRFALEAFYLGFDHDRETDFARSRAAHFEEGAGGLRQWAQAIVDRQPDVLVYPEIGMFPMTVRLASLRLAPVQIATWGHPETTGLPTIDYYLSARDMEPADAEAHYTERLVTLPDLGCSYRPTHTAPVDPGLAELDSAPDVPVFLCPGVPFKYAPQHDRVFTRIARELGRCRFIFFSYQSGELSNKLQRRFELAFEQDGLDFGDFGIFAPWLTQSSFYGLLQRADVLLDTIGFSGFNTAMQAVESALPIVTVEGRFLRGRLASGILGRIGLRELVASSAEEYVTLATRLARDDEYRKTVRERIEAGRHVLFDDDAPIRAMEAFLAEAVGR
jgi:predicted O-linked N-acetylglucosamine transferase (SPINDLY family)